ncbi:MAG TPA: response regulator transcription factor [Patescibacteria group bacterium]|nr:response regulator transcription factor [Patescibacteria group bacterium]
MENKTVLIVDDERNIRILLKDFLEKEGFVVLEAQDGRQALEIFTEKCEELDFILLDVMLPELDGWTVCREIRKQSNVPIVMLTARSEDFDEVHGLEIGADDYVKKPVKPTTLIARINALFRRTEREESKTIMSCNGLEIDDSSHVVKVDGKEIALSPKEYTLLILLVENKGKVISREQLLNQVWGYNYYGGLRTVDTHINRLRMKLMNKGDCISTIRGFGYKLEG